MADARDISTTIRPEVLRPQAEPVDTFVRPAKQADQSANLESLAKGLTGLSSGLSSWLDTLVAEKDAEDKLRAQADFRRNNSVGYDEAVKKGVIPAFASKAYVKAYKGIEGGNSGMELEGKWNEFARTLPKDLSPEEFAAKQKEFFGNAYRAVGSDPDRIAGMRPQVERLIESGYGTYLKERDTVEKTKAANAGVAGMDNTVDDLRKKALLGGKVADFGPGGAEGKKLLEWRDGLVKSGTMTADQADQAMMEMIAQKAIMSGDSTLLKAFDAIVPGSNPPHAYKDTEHGRKLFAATYEKMLSQHKTDRREARIEEEQARKKAFDEVMGRVDQAVMANPFQSVPENLIEEGLNFDKEARSKMVARAKSLREGLNKPEDPEKTVAYLNEIAMGGGAAVVERAMKAGDVPNSSVYEKLRSAVANSEREGGRVSRIMESSTAKMIVGEIKMRLRAGELSKITGLPTSVSNGGFQAITDYRKALLDWAQRNPNASAEEELDAASKIGANIMKNIATNGGDFLEQPGIYTRPAGSPAPTFPMTAAPQGAAAPVPVDQGVNPGASRPPTLRSMQGNPQGAMPGMPTPTQPATPATPQQPAPTQPPADKRSSTDDPAVIQKWYADAPMESRAMIERYAQSKGVSVESVLPSLFSQASASGDPSVTVARASVLRDQGGAPGDDVEAMLRDRFAEGQEPPPEVVSRLATAFRSIFTSDVEPQGGYKLAVLKDSPKVARILDMVSGPESRGNYNAYYGHAGSTKDLSAMSLGEIQQWMRTRGTASSATGRYQFMRETLFGANGRPGLMQRMGLDENTKFTPELQDRMAWQLLKDRGLDDWTGGKISDQEFGNRLAREWAGVPTLQRQTLRVGGRTITSERGQSAYDGYGGNRAGISAEDVEKGLSEAAGLPHTDGVRLAGRSDTATDAPSSIFTAPGQGRNEDPRSPLEIARDIERSKTAPPTEQSPEDKALWDAAKRSGDTLAAQKRAAGRYGPGNVYSAIPEKDDAGRDQIEMFKRWNPDPIGNHEKKLSEVKPRLQDVVRKAQEDNPGLTFVVGSGGRSEEDQKLAEEFGWSPKSKGHHPFAKGTDLGKHIHGDAVDIWPIKDGKVVFDQALLAQVGVAMKTAAAELGVKVRWGGDFKGKKDAPHFELHGDKDGPTGYVPGKGKAKTAAAPSAPAAPTRPKTSVASMKDDGQNRNKKEEEGGNG